MQRKKRSKIINKALQLILITLYSWDILTETGRTVIHLQKFLKPLQDVRSGLGL